MPERQGVPSIFHDLVGRLAAVTKRRYGSRLISLAVFGSVARQTPSPDSDIDILVVADQLPPGRMRRVEEFEAIEDDLESVFLAARAAGVTTHLAPVFRTPAEVLQGGPIFLDMVHDVWILVDQAGFLRGFLDRLGRDLVADGARRHRYKGAWYWDLGPRRQPTREE